MEFYGMYFSIWYQYLKKMFGGGGHFFPKTILNFWIVFFLNDGYFFT